jgi:hypothetical protein
MLAMQCNVIQFNAMQCNAIQRNAMQSNTMQSNTLQCNLGGVGHLFLSHVVVHLLEHAVFQAQPVLDFSSAHLFFGFALILITPQLSTTDVAVTAVHSSSNSTTSCSSISKLTEQALLDLIL